MTEAISAIGKRAHGGTGNFFIIDQRLWKAVCDAGDINAAAAWLLLAQGTGANQRTTAWSVDAIMRYLGVGISRGKEAIDKLIALRFIQYGEKHTQQKPRYDLLTFAEWDALRQKPRKGRNPSANEDSDSNLIWLPNELVTGTCKGEKSPVHKLRAAGDPWALRLCVDLYHAQNLRDDGGISREFVWQEFGAEKIGERGPFRIMGFNPGMRSHNWAGPFVVHEARPKPRPDVTEWKPGWESLTVLEQIGLLSFVPHLLENETRAAEVVHAVGTGGQTEHPLETEIGNEARRAAAAMCQPWQLTKAEGLILCPIRQEYPKALIVGIARLRYRPHTKRTSAWTSNLQYDGPAWVEQYRRIAAEYATQQAAYA
jgi:hypothetical protein